MIKQIINITLEFIINMKISIKLKKIKKNIDPVFIDYKTKKLYKNRWKKLQNRFSCEFLKIFKSLNNIESSLYVPENVYYNKIEPILNNKAYALAYSDKNFYEKYFFENKDLFPDAVLRGINGVFLDAEYNLVNIPQILSKIETNIDYLLKPSTETSGGSNIVSLYKNKDSLIIENQEFSNEQLLNFLIHKYSGNFIIQKKIKQHSWFTNFNKSSVNTIRVFTYRSIKDESVIPLHAVLRFGKEGSLVDNQAAGGLTVGINKDGILKNFACDKLGKKYVSIDFLKDKFDLQVPFFHEIIKLAIELGPKLPYHRLLGFDFCVNSENKIKLLEINCKNIETNFLQMNNGPLFGDFTDEIVEYCIKTRKSVVIDYYL